MNASSLLSSISTSPARWVRILDGSADLPRQLVGGKAWSINWMRAQGLAVPPAVTLTTEAYAGFEQNGELSHDVCQDITAAIGYLEQATGRTFGSGPRPLLISVRSGAAESMPGMMDTILNLGVNAITCAALAGESGDADFASRTRELFSAQYRQQILGNDHEAVPDDVWAQLRAAVLAVLASWNSPRAKAYRQHYAIDGMAGTSVTLQAMVFGNLDENSGSGVIFSRNPATGSNQPFGQWLQLAQGEDIVSGRMDPQPITTLAAAMPAIHDELIQAAKLLESRGRDIQDIEFTIERGKLWLLQTRSAKRSPRAAVNFAVQLCNEDLISIDAALARISPEQVRQLLKPGLDPGALQTAQMLAKGEPACPGIAHGLVVTSSDEAIDQEMDGVVLARPTTSPDDIHGMLAARAIITELGGATSHAAVVSREIGVPCVVGCGRDSLMSLHGQTVTVDGSEGVIYAGELQVVHFCEKNDPALATLIEWAATRAPVAVFSLDDPAASTAVNVQGLDHNLPARLKSADTVCGLALETSEGIQCAVEAGVKAVFVRQRLPALLAALQTGASAGKV